ncbi:MAG TPA: hypothetical protein VMS86_00275 [Thermoanaerobaculia bacterium]|nr:hypothetical protein [Thermoanaerobaculia bacterium]
MKPTDLDLTPGQREADDTPDALDRLLAEVRVPVREGFTRQVMSRLPESRTPPRRVVSREWAVAAGLAAVLVAVAAVLLAGGDGTGADVAASVVDLIAATLAAGAGFLAASWRGLGETIGAALDGSVTALAALGLAALAANGLLFLLLRRRRAERTVDKS